MDSNCKWTFAELSASHFHNGPQDAMIEAFKGSPYAALIREACQNSCDAIANSQSRVKMSLSFGKLNRRDYPKLFDLQSHVKGCLTLYPDDQNTSKVFKPMLYILDKQYISYLRVSDYNTTGMSFYKDLDGKPRGSFYAFVRSGGHSEKTSNTAGGSFGFGKAAYFQISGLRSIIVSTQTEEGKNYFEGISSFCTHQIGNMYFDGHGFYDATDGIEPNTNLEDIPTIFRRNEPGTDFYILGTDQNTYQAKEDMAKSVLRYFWAAILDGILEIDIDGILISKETFSDVLNKYFPEEDDDAIRNHFYKLNPRPYTEVYRLAKTAENFQLIEQDLPLLGTVKLYVNIAPSCNRDKIIYMRKNKMVIQTEMLRNHYGVYCVFVCESDRGNKILRKLENASHDKWDKSNYTENNVPCEEGKAALKELDNFVQDSLRSIFDRETNGTLEVEGLSEYLSSSESLLDELDALSSKASDDLYGIPTGETTTKETGVSTTTSSGATNNKQPETPSILITSDESTGVSITGANNPDGRQAPPNTSEPAEKQQPKEPKAKKPKNRKKPSINDGANGNIETLTLQSRMIAQFSDGVWWHHLILHANRDASKVRLYLKASGEDSATDISIAEAITSDGEVLKAAGDIISDINLSQGKNIIRVRMADNMKYTLIFDGYEA
jgi:hypothetical protein